MVGFSREAIEAVGGEWVRAQRVNEVLETTIALCEPAVERTGDLARSKVAWKLANYRMASIYRGVMLAEAATELWNNRNALGSILAARALMETAATLRHFVNKCQDAYDVRDVGQVNEIVDASTFASRLGWFDEHNLQPAINVLTALDKINKKHPGIRHHYDKLSEFCHPNFLGTLSAFGQIETARIDFSRTKIINRGVLSHVLGGVLLIGMVEIDAGRLEELIPKVADLQAGGSSS